MRSLVAVAATVILGAGLLLTASAPASADVLPSGAVADQSNAGAFDCTNGAGPMWQTFTAGVTGTLTSVTVNPITDSHSTTPAGTVSIFAVDQATKLPTGAALQTAAYPAGTSSAISNLTGGGIAVVSGNLYAIEFPVAATFGCSTGDAYAGGTLYGLVGGVYTSSFPDVDFAFTTYVAPSVVDQSTGTLADNCGGTPYQNAQTFTAGITGRLSQLDLHIYGDTDVGATTVGFSGTDAGGLPDGPTITTATFTFTSPGDYAITLPTPLPVVAGTIYAFLLPPTVSSACQFARGSYQDGTWANFFMRQWNGSRTGTDLQFTTHVIPDAPVVAAVAVSLSENDDVVVPLAITGSFDSVAVVGAASNGTATVNGAGTGITYTPALGYSGPDSFTYTATNHGVTSAAATVSVTVTAPTVVLSATTVSVGDPLTITGTGFPANTSVDVTLHSLPVLLATVVTSPTGGFVLHTTVPGSVDPGAHTIVVTGPIPLTVTTGLTVSAIPARAALAATGSTTGWLVPLGSGLLLLGVLGVGFGVLSRRRTRTAGHRAL